MFPWSRPQRAPDLKPEDLRTWAVEVARENGRLRGELHLMRERLAVCLLECEARGGDDAAECLKLFRCGYRSAGEQIKP